MAPLIAQAAEPMPRPYVTPLYVVVQMPDRSGVGFTSMRKRAQELGSECVLKSNPSGGTVVRAMLPVTNQTR
jgi:signal transduction histidine kinase